MDTVSKIETKICSVCGESFEEEVLSIGGRKIFDFDPICDACAEKQAEAEEKARREAAARAEWERVVPPGYRKTDPQHPEFNRVLWEHLSKWKPEHGGVGLVGETGRCKTRCLSLIAKRLAWRGYRLEWCIATRFQWAAQRQWDDCEGKKAMEWLKRWKFAEVLILDDLGKQRWTDSVEQEFYDLLEYRYSNELLTLWSANTHPEEMIAAKQLTKDRGAPIVGRLLDSTEVITV